MFYEDLVFLNKEYFILFIFFPVVIYWLFFYKYNWVRLIFLNWNKSIFTIDRIFSILKNIIILLILLFSILLLANPNIKNTHTDITKKWIDIVIAFDVSLSMDSKDLKPSRIEAAKKVVSWFIDNLKTDRVWLVLFSWKPFISIPLTFDYNILKENISNISTNKINQNIPELNWTAIWDALLMSNNLFKPSKEESKEDYKKREKVVLLLTDWDANVWVNPELAAKMLKDNNIKIYSIWIWSKVWWEISVDTWFWFIQNIKIPPLNEEKLKSLSQITSWEFFLAYNNEILSDIFKKLSTLEKNDISVSKVITYKQIYNQIIYINIILLFMFIILSFLKVNTKK